MDDFFQFSLIALMALFGVACAACLVHDWIARRSQERRWRRDRKDSGEGSA